MERLVRRALLARAKADAALIALVPAAQIDPDPDVEPTWPYISLESPTTQQFRRTCVRGRLVTFDAHAFARARMQGAAVVETPRDHAGRIGEAFERVFDGVNLTLEDGSTAKVWWSDARLLKDNTPNAYHYFAQINARVLAATV